MISQRPFRGLVILALQLVLIVLLVGAGRFIYHRLPNNATEPKSSQQSTTLQIFIRPTPDSVGPVLDVAVNLYPVDIVAVQHEYFTDPRPGKNLEDFLRFIGTELEVHYLLI